MDLKIQGWLDRDCAELKKGEFVKVLQFLTVPDPIGLGTFEYKVIIVGAAGKMYVTDLDHVNIDFHNI